MKQKQLVFTGLMCLASMSVEAQWTQTPSAQTEQQQTARLATEQSAENINRSIIVQSGSQNVVRTEQQHTGAFLSGNIVSLQQAGDFNTATLTQQGTGLRTDVTQRGNQNNVQSAVAGDNTATAVEQNGSGNQVNQQLNVSERSYLIQQEGNNNVLQQRESGATNPAPGYNVRMVGNGINITIEQGAVIR